MTLKNILALISINVIFFLLATSCAGSLDTGSAATSIADTGLDIGSSSDGSSMLIESGDHISSSQAPTSDHSVPASNSTAVEQQPATTNNGVPYPVFQHINNAPQVNQLIQDYMKIYEDLYPKNEISKLEMQYQVTFQNQQYISILFFGEVKFHDSAYPTKVKSTLTVDTIRVKRVTLPQLIQISDAFINRMIEQSNKSFQAVGTTVLDVFSKDELKQAFASADRHHGYFPTIQSYLKEKEMIVIMSVPHALGDYVTVSLPYEVIEPYLIEKIW